MQGDLDLCFTPSSCPLLEPWPNYMAQFKSNVLGPKVTSSSLDTFFGLTNYLSTYKLLSNGMHELFRTF